MGDPKSQRVIKGGMMIKLLYFLGSWVIGLVVANKLIFTLMADIANNEVAAAILCVLIIMVYTVCLTITILYKDSGSR